MRGTHYFMLLYEIAVHHETITKLFLVHQTNGEDKPSNAAPATNGTANGTHTVGIPTGFGSKRRRVGIAAAGGAAHRRITSQQAMASNAPVSQI